jgi:hypothetical protein
MAEDATNSYIAARAEGKDAAIICDRWEIADAINRKLHGHYTQADAPSIAAARDKSDARAIVRVARDQDVCAGDIIISRNNDASIDVTRSPQQRRGARVDQVRNGNRWRVAAVDPASGQLLAERLTDSARVVFEGEYLREHITLGYATTLHAAQGITVGSSTREGSCFTVLSDQASRAMAYVGMTRGKDENHAFIYQPITGESDHEHSSLAAGDQIHTLRRGNKHAAAHYFRMILANDDRPRTMHAEAERTDRDQLPEVVATLLDRNDERRARRASTWRQHNAAERGRAAAFERIAASSRDTDLTAEQSRTADVDGLEL